MPSLIEDRRTDQAVEVWSRYFAGGADGRPVYSGARFERFAGGGDKSTANEFTSDDLVAVSMLSVNVPPHASIRVLEFDRARCSELLADIPVDVALADAPEGLIGADSSAVALWKLLRRPSSHQPKLRDGIGPTTTSKLMARKRPHLIPVWDSVVSDVTGQPSLGNWDWLRTQLMQNDGSLATWIRSAAPVELQDISTIRLLDVLLWMTGSQGGAADL
ncbi:DUF6308 family protein [Rhodococcoides yunnanense]|jgi:hypothetical protein|uniref:DUF6308 family protein n=1 Tax=Rhodococcoides yunnanense TaxID=278209 RepID=UPI0022B1F90A|nr:DUF6308 family protein [Rhodococcus yunnanensis]MCZ4278835.1 DUF6308 family protein [Rhodococcus yunnanensis]